MGNPSSSLRYGCRYVSMCVCACVYVYECVCVCMCMCVCVCYFNPSFTLPHSLTVSLLSCLALGASSYFPEFYHVFSPSVGGWSTYRITDSTGVTADLTFAIVAEEKGQYWLELRTVQDGAKAVHPEVVGIPRGAGFSPLRLSGTERRGIFPTGAGVWTLKRRERRAPLPTTAGCTGCTSARQPPAALSAKLVCAAARPAGVGRLRGVVQRHGWRRQQRA